MPFTKKGVYLWKIKNMKYSLDSYVKIKSSGKISSIISCEKILGVNIYYLTNGTSCAEHQLDYVPASEFVMSSIYESSKSYRTRSKEAANCLVNNLFTPYFNQIKKEKEKRKKREIINFTILGFLFLGLILLTTFLL